MYCRKCGAKLKSHAKFCDTCGAKVVTVKQDQSSVRSNKGSNVPKDAGNPYIAAASVAVCIAWFLALFPWNVIGKGIGTSLPMRIAVLAFAALADYHATKARQTNNALYKKYGVREREKATAVIYWLSVVISMIGLFALFMA